MIIYSVLPMEVIMNDLTKNPFDYYEETEIGGMKMVVQRVPDSAEAKIVRLISSNPQDYLNPNYFPGQTIHFRPQISTNE